LWMGSNRGVFRARKEDLNELAEGRRRSVTCYAYGRSDGLSTLACATGGQPAACKARDGRLWFATAKGAAVVDPGNLPFNPLPPPVVIEECLIDDAVVAGGVSGTIGPWSNKSAVSGECRPTKRSALSDPPSTLTPIVVPPAKHRVEFRFTALSLVAPERVLFKYRLAGFDDDWVNAGPRRVAQYSYVPPGSYQFRVTACNNNGVWNDAGATLGLIVRPGWWQTGWFRVLAGVGLAGLVFLSYRRRVLALQGARATQQSFSRRLIESQENERKRLAAELHDSLGQNLLVIKNRALLGLQDASATAGALDQLDTISSVASQSLQEVREIAHNLRPCHLDRLGLTKALRAVITSVARASTIEFVPEIEVIDGLLLPEQEINLYRIVQELLNNIVKHSHAAQARLGIRLEDRRLVLTFEDDGCGFDYAAATDHSQGGRGWGLAGIAERVRILGGNLRCDSSPGRGTRWAIDIPVPPARNISQSAVEHEPNRPDSRGN
jgi:signal transduction histidine kinase